MEVGEARAPPWLLALFGISSFPFTKSDLPLYSSCLFPPGGWAVSFQSN